MSSKKQMENMHYRRSFSSWSLMILTVLSLATPYCAQALNWQIETVTTTSVHATSSALISVDSYGTPAILYRSTSSGKGWVFRRGAGWREVAGFDADYLALSESGSFIAYANSYGGVGSNSGLFIDGFGPIAVDNAGVIYRTAGGIKQTTHNGSQTYAVDGFYNGPITLSKNRLANNEGGFIYYRNGILSGTKELVDTRAGYPMRAGLDIDGLNTPHITFATLTSVYYAVKNPSWLTYTVAVNRAYASPVIAVETNGLARVIYVDSVLSQLRCATKSNSTWSYESILSTTNSPNAIDRDVLAARMDEVGNLHIAYKADEGAVRRIYYIKGVKSTSDLGLQITGPTAVSSGQDQTFVLTATNVGPDRVAGVTIQHSIPTNCQIKSHKVSQGGWTQLYSNNVYGFFRALSSNSTASMTVTVANATIGTFTHTAQVFGTVLDTFPANDRASITTIVARAVDLAVTSVALPAGNLNYLDYQLTITNRGPFNATDVVLTDDLPEWVTLQDSWVSQGTISVNGQQVVFNLGDVSTVAVVKASLRVWPQYEETFTNVAYVSSSDLEGNFADNTSIVVSAWGEFASWSNQIMIVSNKYLTRVGLSLDDLGRPQVVSTWYNNIYQDSLTRFDGVVWTNRQLPVDSRVLSLMIDTNGKSFLAGVTSSNRLMLYSEQAAAPYWSSSNLTFAGSVGFWGTEIARGNGTNWAIAFLRPLPIDCTCNTQTINTFRVYNSAGLDREVHAIEFTTSCGCSFTFLDEFSIAMFGSNRIGVAYQLRNTGFFSSDGVYFREAVGTGTFAGVRFGYGDSPSVAYTAGGDPRVLYYSSGGAGSPTQGIVYAWRTNDSWTNEFVAKGINMGNPSWLTLDRNDNPNIVYYRPDLRQLWFARKLGDEWISQPVMTNNVTVLKVRLELDSGGNPHVAFIEDPTKQVRYVQGHLAKTDLGVSKTANRAQLAAGELLTYTMVVSNAGPGVASAVQVRDPLPNGLSFVSATASQGAFISISNDVTYSLGSIEPSQIATLTLVVQPSITGTITNRCMVSGALREISPANNTGEVAVHVVPGVNLVTEKRAYPDSSISNLLFVITVSNAGPSQATGVVMTDAIPATITFLSATSTHGTCSFVNGALTCNLGTINSGVVAQVLVTTKPGFVGPISNRVSVTAAEFETASSNNASVSLSGWGDYYKWSSSGLIYTGANVSLNRIFLELDQSNQPHIVYGKAGPVYSRYTGTNWVHETSPILSGFLNRPAFALSASNVPYFLEQYATQPRAITAYWRVGNPATIWTSVVWAATSGINYALSSADPNHSAVFNRSNQLFVAYYRDVPDLFANTLWLNQDIVASPSSNAGYRVDVGEHDVAIKPSGTPAIAYRLAFNWFQPELGCFYNLVKYWGGAGAGDEVVDFGSHPSLGIDTQGVPHISYWRDGTPCNTYEPGLCYATKTNGIWQKSYVERGQQRWVVSDLAVDSFGRPHIVYYHPGQQSLMHALLSGGQWLYQVLTTGQVSVAAVVLKFDQDGDAHVAYADIGQQSVFYLKGRFLPPSDFSFKQAEYITPENKPTLAIEVVRSYSTDRPVSVDFVTSNLTAIAGTDYQSFTGTLYFAEGQTNTTAVVGILDDISPESEEQFVVRLQTPRGLSRILGLYNTVIRIQDNDVPGILNLAQTNMAVNEAAGQVVLRIERSVGAAGSVSVAYTTVVGTATAGSDYTATGGIINLGPNEFNASVAVPVLNDNTGEGLEKFSFQLRNPTGGASLGVTTQTVVEISDDESYIELSAAFYQVTEGVDGGALRVEVRRNSDSAVPASVEYSLGLGSATPGSDYNVVSGTLNFGVGVSSEYIYIPILDDLVLNEPTETFTIQLSNPSSGLSLGNIRSATVFISDNDRLILQESFNGGQPVGWQVKANKHPANLWRFDDPGRRGNRTGGSRGFAIADSDKLGGYYQRYLMDTELISPVINCAGLTSVKLEFKYDYYYAERIDQCDIDVSVNGKQGPWITVWHRSSASDRGPRTAVIDLSTLLAGCPNAAIRFHHYDARFDWWWQVDDVLMYGLISSANQPTTLSLSASALLVSENSGSAIITIIRSGGTGGMVGGTIVTQPNSAIPNVDYTSVSRTFTILSGEASASVTVPIIDDTLSEESESFRIILSAPTGGASLGSIVQQTVTILDDEGSLADLAINLVAPPDPLMMGSNLPFTVMAENLGPSAASAVKVQYLLPPSALLVSTSLTKGIATNVAGLLTWNIGSLSPFETATATLTCRLVKIGFVTNSASISGFESDTVLENNNQSVISEVGSAGIFRFGSPVHTVSENGTAYDVDVMRTEGTLGEASVTFASIGDSALSGVDFVPNSGVLNFADGEIAKSIQIETIDDEIVEGSEFFYLQLSGATGASLGGAVAAVSIQDDDIFSLLAAEGFGGAALARVGGVRLNGESGSWTVVTNTGPTGWRFDDPGLRGNLTGGSGGFAIADSSFAGVVAMDTLLISPPYSFADSLGVVLEFKTDLVASQAVGEIRVSTNGPAGPWAVVWDSHQQAWPGPQTMAVNISDIAAGSANVNIGFRYYNATNDGWWAVDDVKFYGEEDSDGDQLPDWWETLNFGNIVSQKGTNDFDMDGASNLHELMADTSPTNHASNPDVLRLNVTNGISWVTFEGSPNRLYDLEAARQATGNWEAIETSLLGSGTLQQTPVAIDATNIFYRLRIREF